ncbi:hypothetical protein, partial [Ruminococcus sp.]|uniref:hypothetical protein n=1 Tax=Ruminococcus sp. TaxID=41978 RepID=UPI001B13AF8C
SVTLPPNKAEIEPQSSERVKARGQASRQQACGSLRAEPSITEVQNQNANQTIRAKQNMVIPLTHHKSGGFTKLKVVGVFSAGVLKG